MNPKVASHPEIDCDQSGCWCRVDDLNPAGAMRWTLGSPIPRFPLEET